MDQHHVQLNNEAIGQLVDEFASWFVTKSGLDVDRRRVSWDVSDMYRWDGGHRLLVQVGHSVRTGWPGVVVALYAPDYRDSNGNLDDLKVWEVDEVIIPLDAYNENRLILDVTLERRWNFDDKWFIADNKPQGLMFGNVRLAKSGRAMKARREALASMPFQRDSLREWLEAYLRYFLPNNWFRYLPHSVYR
jgi:hypothetical protein